MIIIGISGKKKSGKDTVYEYIQQHVKAKVIRIGFADSLKEELAEMYGVTTDYIEKHKDNFRLILQGHGTDFRRKLFGNNYWIDKLRNKLVKMYDNPEIALCIIPDVRFTNEYEFLSQIGAILIRVNRDTGKDFHLSEIELDNQPFDYTISNDGTMKQLQFNTLEVLKKINQSIKEKNNV